MSSKKRSSKGSGKHGKGKGKGKGVGDAKKQRSRSQRAGLQFPVGRIARYMRDGGYGRVTLFDHALHCILHIMKYTENRWRRTHLVW